MNIITCEQVSEGHPDKICDQVSDAVVTECLKHDKNSRVAIECLCKDDRLVIAGELTSEYEPDFQAIANRVYEGIGMDFHPHVHVMVSRQSPDIALGVDKAGAGDQGMMFGYATDETPELLPIPYVLATEFLKLLKHVPNKILKPDAKAQVSFDYDTGKITTFLCSVQHDAEAEMAEIRNLVTGLMVLTATRYGLNTDFEKLVNPTGRFVIGGPFADSGLTGRKLACDTYGGVGRIGGGALSGKDPTKVDRSGAYATRKIARDIVRGGYASRCEVQIAYAIGVADPVSIHVDCFGTEVQPIEFINQYVKDSYDLTPNGIIDSLHLREIDYSVLAAYGQFTHPEVPWEQ